jgi:RimJ/RimL family protein N-acetyltransferase
VKAQPKMEGNPSDKWSGRYTGLRTERLVLLAFDGSLEFFHEVISPEVLDQMCHWLNDPKIMQYSELRSKCGTHNRATQETYLMGLFSGRELLRHRVPPCYYFIYQCDPDRFGADTLIGSITAHRPSSDTVDIGIMIGADEGRGHGYAAEAMSAVINAYSGLGIRHFQIGTDLRNRAMIRLAEAVGMKERERSDTHIYMDMRISSDRWAGWTSSTSHYETIAWNEG